MLLLTAQLGGSLDDPLLHLLCQLLGFRHQAHVFK